MTENALVEPGTPLAYSEEYLPGQGTYDDGEQIRAAVFGSQHVDTESMTLTVRSAGKSIASIEKGDVVVGRITYTKPELASVQILEIRGKTGTILQAVEGTLHVSKVDNRYIKDMEQEIQVGDVIRAKVIGLRGGPQLATDKPEFGVLRAYSRERVPLERRGNALVDPSTGYKTTRKIAEDYGSGIV